MRGKDSIYVTFRKKAGQFVGHSIGPSKPTAADLARWDDPPSPPKKNQADRLPKNETPSFERAVHDFLSVMSTYRNMVAATIEISPMVSGMMANRALGEFVVKNGTEIGDLTNQDFSVFELQQRHFASLIRRHEQATAAVNGQQHLPEIATIGLVSAFDAYLSSLLKVVFTIHSEMILTSDREIKYSELAKFPSIEAAKADILEKEVEAIIRQSHHEQFSIMEKRFGLKLRQDLPVWSDFVELCERRNLLTHTGGRVSQQYIKVCEEHGYKVAVKVGDRLVTGSGYFNDAVRIVSEIGIKLGHVLWRKFAAQEREKADSFLNETCFELIGYREYKLAERVLELGVSVFARHSKEHVRRMMVINLANARRLQDNKDGANKTLASEDWSASGMDFRICVSAVKEDIEELCKLIRRAGATGEIAAQQYRDWPVFREVRKDARFKETFAEVFGEPLVVNEKKLAAAVPVPRRRLRVVPGGSNE